MKETAERGSQAASEIHTARVCGLPVAVIDYEGAVKQIEEWAMNGNEVRAVSAANTHVAAHSRRVESFGAAMSQFDLICPDGMPLVWAVNRQLPQEERLNDRVYGPNLMLASIKASRSNPAVRHFFFGGKESTLAKLEERFEKDWPEATITGSYSPPFGEWPEDEFERICEKIRESGANVIWVGLGCPKQEQWIGDHKDKLPPGVYLAVGAAFAFHAGEVSQAPKFLQRIGMEWAYRLMMEPRRLFKRYFVNNRLFLQYWITDMVKNRG
ncbi:MAG: WecB/TagA/CpsF family glycosyltransferase [Verrucomicrobiota bacterium]